MCDAHMIYLAKFIIFADQSHSAVFQLIIIVTNFSLNLPYFLLLDIISLIVYICLCECEKSIWKLPIKWNITGVDIYLSIVIRT